MNRKEIKNKLNSEFNSLVTSNFDSVISKIENKKGDMIIMEKEKPNKMFKLSFAAILVFVACVFGISYFTNDKVNVLTTVIFDVNPSLEIKVNDKEEIVEVIAHNDEAKEIISGMDLNGVDLEVGTNAILGSMLKYGYIDDVKNSILVTVTGNNDKKNKEIEEKIIADIYKYLMASDVNGSVMGQTVNSNSELEALAKKYNITIGKAELINKIISSNPMYTYENLVELSTTELNILANSPKNHVTNITTNGAASEKKYIGKEKAKEIIFNKLGIKEEQVSRLEIELDLDDNVMVYDIEFYYNEYEYDYEVNAIEGTIIKSDKDKEHSYEKPKPTSSNTYISKAKAKEIVLEHAKVSEYYDYDVEFDYEDGYAVYEIDFETEFKEYEYIINAKTGDILYYDTEVEEGNNKVNNNTSNNTSISTSNLITKGKAKNIALNHAGVTTYYDFDIELDTEKGIKIYEVDFETKEYEYEYEINAKTGKIINSDKERKD